MSGEFDSRKDSHSTKLEQRPQIFVKQTLNFHMCTKNHNHMMHGSWNTKWNGNFLSFRTIFCYPPLPHPPPPNNPGNQNFHKIKQACKNVIILLMCTKNHNHMMYASWDMECDRQNFVTLGHFCIFSPQTNPKMTIIWCMVPEIWSTTDWIFCHSRSFFALSPY